MMNLIKKDLIIVFSNKLTIFMIIFYFPLILFMIGSDNINNIFIFSTFAFSFIMTKIPFSYEIKDKPHIFIQSLPVTKSDIVLSKYMSVFPYFIMGLIYTIINILIYRFLGFIKVGDFDFSIILLSLGYIIIVLSISLPMQFKFSPKLANFINMVIFIMFLNMILLNNLPLDIIHSLNIVYIVLGIFAIYLISISTSIFLYKSRNFY